MLSRGACLTDGSPPGSRGDKSRGPVRSWATTAPGRCLSAPTSCSAVHPLRCAPPTGP